jgi:hypothetical protein
VAKGQYNKGMMTEVTNNNSVVFYSSIVLFAVISWAIYKFVLTANSNNDNNTAITPTSSSSQAAATSSSAAARAGGGGLPAGNNNNGTSGGNAINNNNNNKEEDDTETSIFTYRFPPHLNISSSQQKGGPMIDLSSSHLYQGIIPFRSTFASGYETRLSSSSSSSNNKEEEEDIIITNRKSRARIFAKIFSIKSVSDRPPGRGSNVVVVISYDGNDNGAGGGIAKCEKLQKSLMLLATYYNLFLLVNVDNDNEEQQQQHNSINEEEEKRRRDMVRQFRSDLLNITTNANTSIISNGSSSSSNNTDEGNKLNSQILPPHRIIFTSTSEGQVAFVRQLVDTKLILLPSSEGEKVKMELERFGFRVVCYPDNDDKSTNNGENGSTSYSALGQFLIP